MSVPLRVLLRILGLTGLLLFTGLFVVTFISADAVERAGQTFIKYQIEKEIRENYESVTDPEYVKALGRLKAKYEREAKQIQAALNDNLPAKIANVIAAMCRLDCKQRQAVQESIEAGYRARSIATGGAVDMLTELIKGKYLQIVENLTRDVRIFLGSNAILFLFVVILAFLKPRAALQLYLPAVILIVATVISSGLYLFGQNWFFTILYNDYVGFGYVAFVGVLFGFLCDIAFNKAKVTTTIVNSVLEALGSAVQAVPC